MTSEEIKTLRAMMEFRTKNEHLCTGTDRKVLWLIGQYENLLRDLAAAQGAIEAWKESEGEERTTTLAEVLTTCEGIRDEPVKRDGKPAKHLQMIEAIERLGEQGTR